MIGRNIPIAAALAAMLAVPILILFVAHRFAGDRAGLQMGQELPAAQLVSLNGRLIDTRSWKGMPTLLVLFQSTCRICELEIEGLTSIAPSLPGVRIVLLALDSGAPRVPTGFPILTDPSGQLLRKVRKMIVPTLYLLDADGRVIYVRSSQRPPGAELATLTALLVEASRSIKY
jgi:peroxiredoxin